MSDKLKKEIEIRIFPVVESVFEEGELNNSFWYK